MASQASRREITAAQVMAVGGGGAVAGALFLVTGYPAIGLLLLVLGAVIGWGGWRYRSGGDPT